MKKIIFSKKIIQSSFENSSSIFVKFQFCKHHELHPISANAQLEENNLNRSFCTSSKFGIYLALAACFHVTLKMI